MKKRLNNSFSKSNWLVFCAVIFVSSFFVVNFCRADGETADFGAGGGTWAVGVIITGSGGIEVGSINVEGEWIWYTPVVNLTANPSTIELGEFSTLSWSIAQDPLFETESNEYKELWYSLHECTASGDWDGIKDSKGGTESDTPSSEGTKNYSLECCYNVIGGGCGTASATVTVTEVLPPGFDNCGGLVPSGSSECPDDGITTNSALNWTSVGDSFLNCTSTDCEYYTPIPSSSSTDCDPTQVCIGKNCLNGTPGTRDCGWREVAP
jgi:hypothetical protein